jgi:hypothetical protein
MSAIITEKFRQHNAGNFYESFSEASANVYYLMIGKATPFTSATTGGTDNSPPTPADDVSTEFYTWDSTIALKIFHLLIYLMHYLEGIGRTAPHTTCMIIM